MPRKFRLKGKRLYHHIYAWGNDRHPVFKADEHYAKYLDYLGYYSLRYKIEVIAYALMEWHVHLFLFDVFGRISEFMKSLHGEYAQFFNRVTRRVGHVFGERFNNRIVQPNNYGLWLSRYIHRQPVDAGIVNDPKDYPWTSYRAYLGLAPRGFLKPAVILEQFGHGGVAVERYREFVLGVEDGPVNWRKVADSIIGDAKFIEKIEVSIDDGKEDEWQAEDLLKALSGQLKVKVESLLEPRGYKMREIRHKAFVILAAKYGLSAARIARMFKVSATAVAKVLKKQNEKV
ncbi:MAG: transposase [candidate division WOR-3 bacterium]